MEGLVKQAGTIRLRKIDINQWGSPVAEQHDIHRLPRLLLYDGTRLISDDTKRVLQMLKREAGS